MKWILILRSVCLMVENGQACRAKLTGSNNRKKVMKVTIAKEKVRKQNSNLLGRKGKLRPSQ